MITNHHLPQAAFSELGNGAGGPATIRILGDAQRSKHLMLLHAIAGAAVGAGAGQAAFRAGYASWRSSRPRRPGPPNGCSVCPTWAGGYMTP